MVNGEAYVYVHKRLENGGIEEICIDTAISTCSVPKDKFLNTFSSDLMKVLARYLNGKTIVYGFPPADAGLPFSTYVKGNPNCRRLNEDEREIFRHRADIAKRIVLSKDER